ncbi:MAG: S8 family serine peptidase [Thermoleophilia bacterium]
MPTAAALLASACTALTLFAAPAHGELSPDLVDRLATAAPDQGIPVLVTLTRQVDGDNYQGRPEALLAALKRTAAATQPQVLDDVSGPVHRFWLVNAIGLTATPDEIAALNADPGVAHVELDHPVRVAEATTASAPIETFPDSGAGNWGLAAMHVPQVWSATGLNGTGVVLGSIDTGVNADHPDLAGKVVAWRDFVNGQDTPYDDNGHGTHTIGTMVGGAAGGRPIGVAPGAKVIVAKAIAANGVGGGSALMSAAQWMTDPDGDPTTADQPVAVNNSWSADDANDPWFHSIIQRWLQLGITPVFAAGNTGPGPSTVGSPAGYPESLAVGATADDGTLAEFSSRGPVNWLNLDGTGPAAGTVITKPDVVAPGVNITSSVNDGYVAFSGTSMASPQVAGVLALLAQANPAMRGAPAEQVLRNSARDMGPAGMDQRTGAGAVDALAAVEAVVGPVTVAQPPQAVFSGRGPVFTRRRIARLRVNVQNGDALRWRVNGGKWSSPTAAQSRLVRLHFGRNLVEAQAMQGSTMAVRPARRVVVRKH